MQTTVKNQVDNRQNLFVAVSMEQVELTLKKLFELNLTVMEVRLGGQMPLVRIQYGTGCKELQGHIFAKYRRHSPHLVTKRASLNQCIVEWDEARAPASTTRH